MEKDLKSERERRWRGHLRAWKSGGGSQAAYCRQHGLKPADFSWWKRELARREGVASCPAPAADVAEPARFIPVRASSAVAPVPAAQTRTEIVNSTTVGRAVIEIVLSNGRIVRVGAEFDSAALGRVLSAADQPC